MAFGGGLAFVLQRLIGSIWHYDGYTYLARALDSLLMATSELPPLLRSHNPMRVAKWSRTKLSNQGSLKAFYQKVRKVYLSKKRSCSDDAAR